MNDDKKEMSKDEEFMATMRKRYAKAKEFESENREEMNDDIKFSYGGEHQWDYKTYKDRQTSNRPALTINRIKTPIKQVSNEIRQNKPSIKVFPNDDQSDPEIASIYEGLIRSIETNSVAQVAYQTAVDGAIRCGYGAFEIRNVYTNDDSFDQDIVIKRILNQFTVYFDPSAKEITKEDARWVFVTESLSEEAFKEKYPDKEAVSFQTDSSYDLWFNDSEGVRIARYYVKEPVTKTLAQFPDGSVSEVTKDQEETGILEDMGITKTRKVKSHKVMCYIVSGNEILEDPYEVPGRYIPVIPVVGEETVIDGQVKLSGIVRDAKDPQRLYNYWRTTAAETIALQPRVPWLVTPKMIEGNTNQWNNANSANLPFLLYKFDEQAGMPKRETPPIPPTAMWQESSIAGDDIKFTTSVFDAGLGNTGPEQSGKAILARQNASEQSNFIFIDNLSIAMRHAGKILIDMIPKVYDTQRVIRILNPDDTDKMVTINQVLPDNSKVNDITIGKYDVTVATGPSFQTRRAEAAATMMSFMQAVPSVGVNIADLVAKNMDWPGADEVAERARKMIPPQLLESDQEDLSPEEAQAKQMAQQEAEAYGKAMRDLELAEKKAGVDLDVAKAQETLSKIDQAELQNLFRVLQATGGNNGQA